MYESGIESFGGDVTPVAGADARQALRLALGRFPTGVAIVTTLADNAQPIGMTINSFSSVSLTPPLISWCIDSQSAAYEIFANATRFAVTVLAAEQSDLAMRFATRGANKFRDIDVCCNRPPLIPGGCAWFDCQTSHSLLLGDHRMLIGRVLEFDAAPGQPLAFADGRLQGLPGEASRVAAWPGGRAWMTRCG